MEILEMEMFLLKTKTSLAPMGLTFSIFYCLKLNIYYKHPKSKFVTQCLGLKLHRVIESIS